MDYRHSRHNATEPLEGWLRKVRKISRTGSFKCQRKRLVNIAMSTALWNGMRNSKEEQAFKCQREPNILQDKCFLTKF